MRLLAPLRQWHLCRELPDTRDEHGIYHDHVYWDEAGWYYEAAAGTVRITHCPWCLQPLPEPALPLKELNRPARP